ncbi:MAG: response regulator transcription factor [Salinivirgaceae bacterium]
MINVLIVEDEVAMAKGLQDNLEFEGYRVDLAFDGSEGLEKALNESYQLILLDVMLPGISGFDICKTLRSKGLKVPIIMLTAKAEEIDKVLGLEFGADDYLTKPFSLRELLARIRALLRRVENHQPETDHRDIQIGNLLVNFAAYTARVNNQEVKLSHKEFDILHHLYQHKNQTVSRDDLLDQVWGSDYQPTSRTIDNFILKLRQKIENDPNDARIILTVHGVGYKLLF